MCRGVVVPTLGIPTLWSVFSSFFFFLNQKPNLVLLTLTSCFYKMPVNI